MTKVLGIVISHRKSGNSELLVKEIMSSIPQPCQRELIRLTDLKIEPCRACYKCLQPDQDCPTKDDFNFVIDQIRQSDAVIIGVPVYILGPHGYYKMLTDRLVGNQNHVKYTRGKPCALVIPYGTIGWEGYSKAAALILPQLLQMQVVDCWQVHSTLPGESMLDLDNQIYARKLGHELWAGREYQPGARECPFCGSDLFRLGAEGAIECPICGVKGKLKDDNLPDFSGNDHSRFSDQALNEHFGDWLNQAKQRFWAEKGRLKEVQKDYRSMEWWIKP
ncbi:MAG: flavodoxin family protein [Syntrophomonadaceae bacterium]|nr:flavodoxin family protein [Syntrophomonadaceae bacterium]